MNKLKNELSPYLLQHANNPVDWNPWSEDVIHQAKLLKKPIFLSIGYSACHWCHVMESESFCDDDTAKYLNDNFISIKVDREERPDLDKVYMDAVVSMTGSGGWPLSVFLTPDGLPFYGGTYFPPKRRYGMPSFLEVLSSVKNAWENNNQEIVNQGQQIISFITNQYNQNQDNFESIEIKLDDILSEILEAYDWGTSGWIIKPKFPHALLINALLATHSKQNEKIKDLVINNLNAMSKGGLFDILRGGFHRYTVDENWRIPHFEKMLYDNALLANNYLVAGLLFQNDYFLDITKKSLEFAIHELLDHNFGFWSSLDADSEGEEGLYYVWDYKLLESHFKPLELWSSFNNIFDITPEGNFEGQNTLHFKKETSGLDDQANLEIIFDHLLSIQKTRIRPETDKKILVDWNSIMISTLAKAGFYLERKDFLDLAASLGNKIYHNNFRNNRLFHLSKDGVIKQSGFLSDYANFIIAMLDLFQTTNQINWLEHSIELANLTLELFYDGHNFFDTSNDSKDAPVRPRTTEDNIMPSGISQILIALLRLNSIDFNHKYNDIVNEQLSKYSGIVAKYPISHPNMLYTINLYLLPTDSFILVLNDLDKNNGEQIKNYLLQIVPPHANLFILDNEIQPLDKITLFSGKKTVNNKSTLYVCDISHCSPPMTDFEGIQTYFTTK